MKCVAEKDIKNCSYQEICCEDCTYEDCDEWCNSFCGIIGDCRCCKDRVWTMHDDVIRYNLDKLAAYLYSWQGKTLSIDEIKKCLNEKSSEDI